MVIELLRVLTNGDHFGVQVHFEFLDRVPVISWVGDRRSGHSENLGLVYADIIEIGHDHPVGVVVMSMMTFVKHDKRDLMIVNKMNI